MRKVYIIYRSFYDENGREFTVGGIQTYIRQLISLLKKRGDIPVVVQFSSVNFHYTYNSIDVYGIKVDKFKRESKKTKQLLNFVKNMVNVNDLVIFATEDMYIESNLSNVIAIQHGVGWDIPKAGKMDKSLFLQVLRKSLGNYIRLKKVAKLNNLVCVDYNYVNWYRSQTFNHSKNLYVIPNSTGSPISTIEKDNTSIDIIFARRFVEFRGTRLFSSVIKKVLQEYQRVNVTFAGKGPEETYLKKTFYGDSRVSFINYKSEDSLDVHKKFNIAVVPTKGSEGTSLSLLEAMASGCAVIATNVGGMTNIILDSYNGLLVNPNEQEIYLAIERLINDNSLRNQISKHAMNSVQHAFNIDLWERKWNEVLDKVT